jgi:hypothetical protein
MHSEYFAGIAKYDYGSLAARIDATSTAGISFIRFGVDDIPDTSELIDSEGNIHYDNIKSFSAVDYAFLFSFAKMTKINGFRYGANAKIIHRIAGSFAKSWGFGLDLGLRYDFNKWTFGLMCRDVSSTFNAWDYSFNDQMIKVFSITGNEIPKNTLEVTKQSFILGAARKFSILNSHLSILPAIDFDITTDGERNVLLKGKSIGIAPHAGLELGYRNIVFVRGGITNIQKESDMNGNKSRTFQPNLGAGVNIKNILSIDYALTDIGNNSLALYSNIFSLKLNINRKK